MEKIKIAAVCGWAVGADWFEDQSQIFLPGAKVSAIYPENPSCSDEAKRLLDRASADIYLGHSLGSLWLLHHKGLIVKNTSVFLLSPILAFPKEKNLGGKISSVQLKYLKKILKSGRNNYEPIINFFSTWDLQDPNKLLDQLPDNESLLNGLDFLMSVSYTNDVPDRYEFIVGEQDDLLDPMALRKILPELVIVPEEGHNPIPLLKHFSPLIKAEIRRLQGAGARAATSAK